MHGPRRRTTSIELVAIVREYERVIIVRRHRHAHDAHLSIRDSGDDGRCAEPDGRLGALSVISGRRDGDFDLASLFFVFRVCGATAR